jgi:hypothetical protein
MINEEEVNKRRRVRPMMNEEGINKRRSTRRRGGGGGDDVLGAFADVLVLVRVRPIMNEGGDGEREREKECPEECVWQTVCRCVRASNDERRGRRRFVGSVFAG